MFFKCHVFQALEKMGHVRCARVANNLDIITIMPSRVCWCCDMFCCCCCCCCVALQSRRYWHVGARVLLFADGRCEISYERETLTYREQLENELAFRGAASRKLRRLWKRGSCGKDDGDFLKNHSCKEYMLRLEAAREHLEARDLQHFYARQARRSITSMNTSPAVDLKDLQLPDEKSS